MRFEVKIVFILSAMRFWTHWPKGVLSPIPSAQWTYNLFTLLCFHLKFVLHVAFLFSSLKMKKKKMFITCFNWIQKQLSECHLRNSYCYICDKFLKNTYEIICNFTSKTCVPLQFLFKEFDQRCSWEPYRTANLWDISQ